MVYVGLENNLVNYLITNVIVIRIYKMISFQQSYYDATYLFFFQEALYNSFYLNIYILKLNN